MGKIKGNTTIVEVADTTLVSQQTLSFQIMDNFLEVAGYSGKAKNRKPKKRYEMQVSLGGLYDPEASDASADFLISKLQGKERVKVATGSDVMDYNIFYGYIKSISEEMNKDNPVSYQAKIISDSEHSQLVIPWLMSSGDWDDTGVWKDYRIWDDSPPS